MGRSIVPPSRPGADIDTESGAAGREREHLVDGRGAGQDDREDVELADAARDELGVLRAKVEDYDCRGVHEAIVNGREVRGSRREVREKTQLAKWVWLESYLG